jgi:hypothetical protein
MPRISCHFCNDCECTHAQHMHKFTKEQLESHALLDDMTRRNSDAFPKATGACELCGCTGYREKQN